jgi:hypothetical protein
VHFLCFFLPAVVAPGVWAPDRKALATICLITGPLTSQFFARRLSGETGWRLEWAGVWW